VPRGQRDGSLRPYSRFSRPTWHGMTISMPTQGTWNVALELAIQTAAILKKAVTGDTRRVASPAREPTQRPIQWLQWLQCRDGDWWNCTSTPPYVIMAWYYLASRNKSLRPRRSRLCGSCSERIVVRRKLDVSEKLGSTAMLLLKESQRALFTTRAIFCRRPVLLVASGGLTGAHISSGHRADCT
jgi:hypothetical protein